MLSAIRIAAAVLASLLFWSCVAFASDAVVILTAAGEAYEGPPKFIFLADDNLIGAGRIDKSVDTSSGARLENIGKRQDQIQSFIFTVPDIESVASLDIEFANDAWAGEGKTGDRNLFVIGLLVSSVQVDPTGIALKSAYFGPSSFKPLTNGVKAQVTSTWAALYSSGSLRLERPAAGWVEPKSTETTSPQAAVHASPKKTATVETPKPAKKKPLRKKKRNAQSAAAKSPPAAIAKANKGKRVVPDKAGAESIAREGSNKNANSERVEAKATSPERSEAEQVQQSTPRNFSSYAISEGKCQRFGETTCAALIKRGLKLLQAETRIKAVSPGQ